MSRGDAGRNARASGANAPLRAAPRAALDVARLACLRCCRQNAALLLASNMEHTADKQAKKAAEYREMLQQQHEYSERLRVQARPAQFLSDPSSSPGPAQFLSTPSPSPLSRPWARPVPCAQPASSWWSPACSGCSI